ncbi:hypothetical protein BGW42_007584 [Actinomortierella wolfii]|nr:hypothetical protein BGW42_007584 [Actinomortierella wolfii]
MTPAGLTSAGSLHGLTRREVFQNLANRIIYSKAYMILYFVMALLSVWSIFLSFRQGCGSSTLFVVLEVIINTTMIAEVGLRLTALGEKYWRSTSNILDIFLVIFCLVTLILVLEGCGSGHEAEELLDTILLVLRNAVQFWRLFMMIRKNKQIVRPRGGVVDFNNVRPSSLDIEEMGIEAYHDSHPFLADHSDDDF